MFSIPLNHFMKFPKQLFEFLKIIGLHLESVPVPKKKNDMWKE